MQVSKAPKNKINMKRKTKNSIIREISDAELKMINAGGATFYWLGQMAGFFSNFCEKVQAANLEAPVSVSTWN